MDYSVSESKAVLIVNRKHFAQILKRLLSVGSLARLLSQKYGDELTILYTDSPEVVKDYVQSSDIQVQLLLMDLNALALSDSLEDGMDLLKDLRRDFRLKAPVIIFCYDKERLISDPNSRILKRVGHYLLEIPFSLADLKSLIEQTQSISDEELERISAEDCTTMGIISQITKRMETALCIDDFSPDTVKEAKKEFKKRYDDLMQILAQSLPGYFGTEWKKKVETWLGQMASPTISSQTYKRIRAEISQQLIEEMLQREIIAKALAAEAFRSLFHGSTHNVQNKYWPLTLAIQDFLYNVSPIDRITHALEGDRWWELLESELFVVRRKLKAALEDKSPIYLEYLEHFLKLKSTLCEFKEYVKYIEYMKEGIDEINLSELKQRSKEALFALSKLGKEIGEIQTEYKSLKKGRS